MRSSIHTAVAGIVGVAIGALGVIVVDYFGSSTGLPVATQSEAGPPCSGLDVPLPVSDLSAVTEGCRTEGVTISFPDGTAVEAGGLGVVVGYDSSETPDKYYSVVNLGGRFGTIARLIDRDNRFYWGTEAGVAAMLNSDSKAP